jgi:hypothetical protein
MLAALMLALPASSVTTGEETTGGNTNNKEATNGEATNDEATTCEGRRLATLRAELTGEEEVPGPGDLDATGSAVIKVFKAQVFFKLTVDENIDTPTAAHIHLGLRGEAGPVVAPLDPPPPTGGSSSACVNIPRALSLELVEHPGRYYVNVHNDEFPDGAIRGQLYEKSR